MPSIRQRGTTITFGGGPNAGPAPQDTWEWNGTTWTHLNLTGFKPPGAASFGMTTDSSRGKIVMVQEAGLYEWSNAQWTSVPEPTPPARIQTAIALDPVRHQVVMFGGNGPTLQTPLPDTWIWNGTWRQYTGTGPQARWGANMVYDRAHDEIVLFGGFTTSGNTALQDTWVWKVDHWIPETPTTVPPRRHDFGMAYDDVHGQVVMFGGATTLTNYPELQDTWTWDGTNWTPQSTATKPANRYGPAFAYDPVRQAVVMFGGATDATGNSAAFADTWTWDGQAWTQLTIASSPTGRFQPEMAWDAARKRLVMFGGRLSGLSFADAWEWDGTQWVQIGASDPQVTTYPTLAPNLDGAGVLCFGGTLADGSTAGPVAIRRLQWNGATAAYETCVEPDFDRDGLVGCADPDCWWSCTPTCPPGTTCPSGQSACGDGVCNGALESCSSCTMDCGACPDVCGDFTCSGTESTTTCPRRLLS